MADGDVSRRELKLVLIGAGSFVFGPSAVHDAIERHKLNDVTLELVDPNAEAVEAMAAFARGLATRAGVRATVRTHANREAALDGADFVLCAAAVDMRRRFATDVDLVHRIIPGHVITEFGGVVGVLSTLRQVAMIQSIAVDMRRQCPNAWLLLSSNPLPRTTQAAAMSGVNAVGFCNNSEKVYGLIAKAMLSMDESFPWAAAKAKYEATCGGPNHLTWLLKLTERATGRDMTGEFRERLLSDADMGAEPWTKQILDDSGYLCTAGDHHFQDFLPPTKFSHSMHEVWHGGEDERRRRLDALRMAEHDPAAVPAALGNRSWEYPLDLVAALGRGRPASFFSLNLVNEGQIAELPRGVVVETPATADAGGVRPMQVALPQSLRAISAATVELSDALTRAALNQSREGILAVVDRDPTILDKPAGRRAVEEGLSLHRDLIGHYD
ncbi:MAG TPA: hypothetical protein VGN72_20295 [Tepidisphaeraceae bacterium]|jgi:alpha-galactosidase|nr:hypothetical protein [Tepidisphaeraceae bacterium]